MADFAQLTPGEVFAGRYRVEHLIAAGGMGAVYASVHTGTLRKVALKVMRPEIVADAGARARFAKEAQVSARLESPNVVDVLDAGIDQPTGIPFFVMELLVGKELGNLLKERGRLTPQEVVTWLAQAARALDKAHAAGIVHRDLKPENLFLVMREGEAPIIKVLDFGIARIREGATNAATMAGGTPLYMAPEQTSRSATIGPHTDVWALALTAYTLIVGAPYWNVGDNLMSLYQEVLSAPLESPVARASRRGVMLPAAFDAWFFRCVNRDPNTRLAKATEAMRQLGEVFGVAVEISRQFAVQTPQPPPVENATVMSPQQFVPPSAHGTAIPNQYGATAAPATQAAAPVYPEAGSPAGTVVGGGGMYAAAATGGGAPLIPPTPMIPPNTGGGGSHRRSGSGGGGGANPMLLGVLGLLAVSAIGFGVYMAVKPSGSSAAVDEAKKSGGKDDDKKTSTKDDDDDDKKKTDPEKDKKKKLQDEDDDEGAAPKKEKTQPKPIGGDTDDDPPPALTTATPPPPPPPTFVPQPKPTFAPQPKPKPPTGSNCAPGVVNDFGRCSCPAGFKSKGPPGNAHCIVDDPGDDEP